MHRKVLPHSRLRQVSVIRKSCETFFAGLKDMVEKYNIKLGMQVCNVDESSLQMDITVRSAISKTVVHGKVSGTRRKIVSLKKLVIFA